MRRNGKTLRTLRDGHPRRLSDGRNAWRKMTDEQRLTFLRWVAAETGVPAPAALTVEG